MSDTPETDKAGKFWPCEQLELVDSDFARRLERERDEARNMVEKLTEQGLAMMDENRSLKREIKKLKKSSNHKL
jgi:predicted transcriptional regulator